jgi:hypothetical protein
MHQRFLMCGLNRMLEVTSDSKYPVLSRMAEPVGSPDVPHRVKAKDRHARKQGSGPPHFVLYRSAIDAEGCYTTELIHKGDLVVEYTGPHLTIPEAEALYAEEPRTYLFGLSDGKHVIDGDGVAAFINHSCDPNCEVDEVDGRVFVTAIREIQAGEEITYDYNLYDGDPDDPAPCFCGAGNCRGSMYSKQELARRAKVLKQREEKRNRGQRRSDLKPSPCD